MAYVDTANTIGYYSTVGVVKYTSDPVISILEPKNGNTYEGLYSQEAINDEDIKKVLRAFKLAYKEKGEKYEGENIKIEDVTSLVESFSGKSINLVMVVISSIMLVIPSRDFITLMEMAKSVAKIKFIESIMKKNFEEGIKKDINNNIIN